MLDNPWLIHMILGLFFSYGAVKFFASSKMIAFLVGVFGVTFLLSTVYFIGTVS